MWRCLFSEKSLCSGMWGGVMRLKKISLVEREMGKSYLLTIIIIVKSFNSIVKIFFNNGFKSNKNSFDLWFLF
jgi:hypothetical protein